MGKNLTDHGEFIHPVELSTTEQYEWQLLADIHNNLIMITPGIGPTEDSMRAIREDFSIWCLNRIIQLDDKQHGTKSFD